MLYGHTTAALLAPEYQVGRWFDIWLFQRGLTSSLFLLLGGFAFSIATSRHWSSHLGWSPALVKRLRRFSLYLLLGYALHLPGSQFADLWTANDTKWRAFLAVDVLQLIGVSFIAIQLLVLVSRSRRVFMIAVLTLSAAAVFATPAVWMIDWTQRVPPSVAAYLSQAGGSQFPLFPWLAFILLGAGLGQLYARWGASDLLAFAQRALIAPGLVLIVAAYALRPRAVALFGSGPGDFVPAEILLRAGTCLIILAVFAYLESAHSPTPARVRRRGAGVPAHLLRSPLHRLRFGLEPRSRPAIRRVPHAAADRVFRDPGGGFDGRLAWYWNGFKHVRPRGARWVSYAIGAALVIRLL